MREVQFKPKNRVSTTGKYNISQKALFLQDILARKHGTCQRKVKYQKYT
jgi:cytochrome b subunit of formate dehydrogenase